MPLARLKEFSPAFRRRFRRRAHARSRARRAAPSQAAPRLKQCAPRSTNSTRASLPSRKIEAASAMNPHLTASNIPRGFTFAATHCGLKKYAPRPRHPRQRHARRGRRRFHDESSCRRPRCRLARAPAANRADYARPHREFRQRELLHARRWLPGVDRDDAKARRRTRRRGPRRSFSSAPPA